MNQRLVAEKSFLRQDMKAALQLLPLRSLPAFLCPRTGSGRQPPVMRLGYPVPYSWVEIYAEENDLLAYENYPDCGICGAINMSKTIANIIHHINEKADLTSYKVADASIYRINCVRKLKEPFIFIGIASNFLDCKPCSFPSKAEIERLKRFLRMEEEPMWYLDAKEFLWADRKLCYR